MPIPGFYPEPYDDIEVQQFIFLDEDKPDWYLANCRLPSAQNNPSVKASNFVKPHILRNERSFWFYLAINSMPVFRGMAEWIALPITGPNFLFGYIANIIGFLIKGLGDLLIEGARLAFIDVFVENIIRTFSKLFSGRWQDFKSGLIGLLILPFTLTSCFIFISILWAAAQLLFVLSNTINYIRNLFDGITNLVVSFVSIFTKFFFDDPVNYTNPWYSLYVITKNSLLLAPIILLLVLALVPIAGPFSAFLGSVIFNIGVTSGAGWLNLYILLSSSILLQLFPVQVKAIESACKGIIKFFSKPDPEEISSEIENILEDIAEAKGLYLHQARDAATDKVFKSQIMAPLRIKLKEALSRMKKTEIKIRYFMQKPVLQHNILLKGQLKADLLFLQDSHNTSADRDKKIADAKAELQRVNQRIARIKKRIFVNSHKKTTGLIRATISAAANTSSIEPLISDQAINYLESALEEIGIEQANYKFYGTWNPVQAGTRALQQARRLARKAKQADSLNVHLTKAIMLKAEAKQYLRLIGMKPDHSDSELQQAKSQYELAKQELNRLKGGNSDLATAAVALLPADNINDDDLYSDATITNVPPIVLSSTAAEAAAPVAEADTSLDGGLYAHPTGPH